MSENVNVNKIDEKQKKQAEHIADKLEDKGLGHDDAKSKALEEVAQQKNTRRADPPKQSDEHRAAQGEEETGGPKAR